jgi:dimethylamine/trimethylamine dehydrogenase
MPTSSSFNSPIQARTMDKEDIKNLRRAHRAAALRARTAGYDLVYVYAGHGLGIFQQFLSRATNMRSDDMAGRSKTRPPAPGEGSRTRKPLVPLRRSRRIAMNEFLGADGLEPAELKTPLADGGTAGPLGPVASTWDKDLQSSLLRRGLSEPYIRGVKNSSKPVVGVGHYPRPIPWCGIAGHHGHDWCRAVSTPILPAQKDRGEGRG